MTTATSPPPPPPDTEQAAQQQPRAASGPAHMEDDGHLTRPESAATTEASATAADDDDLAGRLVCAVCDGVLASDVALASHIQEHGLNHTGADAELLGFACRTCRRVFADAEVLDRHVLSHPGEQVFKCPLCGLALRTNGGLARHTRRHLDGRPFPPCLSRGHAAKRPHQSGDEADYEVEAKRRSPSTAGSDEEVAVPAAAAAAALAPAVPRFTCPVCPPTQPFRAQYLPELEAHLEQSHSDYRVSCELCGGSFRSVRDLNLHVHTAHRSGGKGGRGRDVVGFKDLTFVDFSSQKFAHIARAECEKSLHRAASRLHPFQCECGLAFPCDSALAIHRQACPNTVYVDSPADLSRGLARPLLGADPGALRAASPKGDFLAKLDLSPQGAAHHLRAAAAGGVLPYADRDLADIQSILSVSAANVGVPGHLGHLGHDPCEEREDHEEQQDAFAAEFRRMKQRGEFPCRLCPEVFPNLRALKGHNRAHMAAPGADGYRCNMCPHAALDKVALQRHMRTHNGARPYECALCRFAFTTKANCERHLRNRHAKCSRDEVKSSIIYHPSEDPGNDPEQQRELQQLQQQQQHLVKLDVKRSLFPDAMMLEGEDAQRRRSLDVGTMTSASEDDADDRVADEPMEDQDEPGRQSPLDLSMVLDLSKKRAPSPSDLAEDGEDVPEEEDDEEPAPEDEDDQPQDLSRKSTSSTAEPSAAAEPAGLHLNNQSTPLQSPEAAATAAALPFPLYVNPYQTGLPLPGQGLGQGLAPGLLPYYPGLLRSLQLGPLGQVGGLVLEPMRLLQRPPFMPANVAADGAVPMADMKDDGVPCPAASPKSERSSASESQQQHSASGGSSSGSGSKMVMKNGVLMPKQKQRRYRTERPHVCEHCSARFTLSSNRERHVKHQHPQFWSQRHRGPAAGNPGTPPTPNAHTPAPDHASTPLRAPSVDLVASSKHEEDDEDEGLVIDEERPSSEDHHDDDGVDGDAEDEGHVKAPAPASAPTSAGEDLASVSRLLNNTSIQSFRQYLRDDDLHHHHHRAAAVLPHPGTPSGREAVPAGRDAVCPEEGLGSEEDVDEEGLVAGSPSEGNNSGSEQDKSESEAAAAPPKKKSAYSLAPNRVCCPYCSRKFPWTSSLRRHVLTHTGQKPYKCTFCPLLFTTKSNCDRHLARKHSNKKDANSSSSSGVSSTPNSSTTSVSPGGSASSGSPPEPLLVRASALSPQGHHGLGHVLGHPLRGLAQYPLRNVPERPYRCRHCPSSTFATLNNLRKHVATKHTGASLESCILPGDVSGYESHGSISDAEHGDDRVADDEKKADVKVPVFSPSLEQPLPLSLCKAERSEDVQHLAVKPERMEVAEESAINLHRTTDTPDRPTAPVVPDIMREAHNSLMSSTSPVSGTPAAPISAPVVSIPEGVSRTSESSVSLPSSELPFKCHLCDGSFTERQECLDHIKLHHAAEYDVLLSKGALELSVAHSPEDNGAAMDESHHADGENIEHVRGKFPDYANRKVRYPSPAGACYGIPLLRWRRPALTVPPCCPPGDVRLLHAPLLVRRGPAPPHAHAHRRAALLLRRLPAALHAQAQHAAPPQEAQRPRQQQQQQQPERAAGQLGRPRGPVGVRGQRRRGRLQARALARRPPPAPRQDDQPQQQQHHGRE
ncbi:hypothetical protein ONE63_004872 [Megalurothrips usitatus]|uniref:C2H2-type domain-containing protein n=1 Tax=Megalurothrips usitatus TaxID=439358 RepID=A0AAV7X144_9NEOP|nr:hypothetical protein ONE63_004872 [Megalurothrips usitatus]